MMSGKIPLCKIPNDGILNEFSTDPLKEEAVMKKLYFTLILVMFIAVFFHLPLQNLWSG